MLECGICDSWIGFSKAHLNAMFLVQNAQPRMSIKSIEEDGFFENLFKSTDVQFCIFRGFLHKIMGSRICKREHYGSTDCGVFKRGMQN